MIKTSLGLAFLLALTAVAAEPATPYIEAPYPLGRVIAEATNILVVQIDKVDKTKNLIIFKKVQDLKGKHPTDVIRQSIGQGGFHPREWQNIMAYAEPGKLAVIFHNGGASETAIDTYWYQAYAGGDWWNMSHAEPFLLRAYAGKAEKLAQAVMEILAGREVVLPAMVDGNKDDLHLRRAKVQRLRASLKLQDYNAQRDFVGWGNEDFRRLLGMPGFTHVSTLPRIDPDVHGAAAVDFNGDGLADVCLYGESKVVVLKNEGTALSEVALPYVGGARGAAWADYNGDGKPDLLLAAPSGVRLLTNLGASFRDDTAGLPKEAYHNVTAATWIDYDGDGKPDLLVSNGFLGLRLYRNIAGKAAAGPPELPQAGPWQFIGPFDNTGQKGFDTVYPPEKEINLQAQYDGKGGKVGWKQGAFADGQAIDLMPSFKPEQTTWCVVYLYREITVKTATELPIGLGSDDTLSVWLNGKKIVSENIYRGVVADGTLATLELKPGKNALLMKICQGEGGYGFYYSAKEPKSTASSAALFEDVSEKVGLGPDGVGGRARGDHLAVADVDGDGRLDFLCSGGDGVLALNTPKGFIEAKDSGIRFQAGRVTPAFGDYDGDGKADLFVPQNGVGKLFHNEGKGKFKETSAAAGDLSKPLGQAKCAVWVDLNNKGKLDLLVGCVRGPNRYFRNLGDGRFEDAGDSIGLYQKILNTCGLAVLDLNKDGVMDLILANEGSEPLALLGDPARTGKK